MSTGLVTHEHVLWAYRLLLGREPESDAAVRAWIGQGLTPASLRDRFMGSREFDAAYERLRKLRCPPRPVPAPVSIEEVVDDRVLELMLAHVSREWGRLGQADPYWSVLTDDRYRLGAFARHRDAFFASGRAGVDRLRLVLARNGLPWPEQGTALEHGCGVGRMTIPLARSVLRVCAVDVSESHMQLARDLADTEGLIDRVDWLVLRRAGDLAAGPPLDLVYSCIVLQHNPPPVIEAQLRQLLRRLRPGGVAVFQLPTFIPGYRFAVRDYLAAVGAGRQQGMEMHMLTQRRVFELLEDAGAQACEVFQDEAAGPVYTSHTFVARKRG